MNTLRGRFFIHVSIPWFSVFGQKKSQVVVENWQSNSCWIVLYTCIQVNEHFTYWHRRTYVHIMWIELEPLWLNQRKYDVSRQLKVIGWSLWANKHLPRRSKDFLPQAARIEVSQLPFIQIRSVVRVQKKWWLANRILISKRLTNIESGFTIFP